MDVITTPPPPNTPCVLWDGYIGTDGYGRTGTHVPAHRAAYESSKGRIPDGLDIDHLCRTPLCINPEHLEAVTPAVNTLRGVSFSAINHRKVKCDNGHPFDAANTYRRPNGHRDCRECIRARARAYGRRQRARVAA